MQKLLKNKKYIFISSIIAVAVVIFIAYYITKPKSYIMIMPFRQELKLKKGNYYICYSNNNQKMLLPDNIEIRKVDTATKNTMIDKDEPKEEIATRVIYDGKQWIFLCSFDILENGMYEITGYQEKGDKSKTNILIIQ